VNAAALADAQDVASPLPDASGDAIDATIDGTTEAGSDGGSADTSVAQDSGPSCGGLGQTCCNGTSCNASLECRVGLCVYPAITCSATLVVSGAASFLAVDSTYLYWSGTGGFARIPLSGGPVQLLGAGGGAFAIDGSHLYFPCGWSDLCSIPLDGLPDGGSPLDLGRVASGSSTPVASMITVDTTSVYATAIEGNPTVTVSRLPIGGLPEGGSAQYIGLGDPHIDSRLVVDPTALYWSGVSCAPLDGGPVTRIGAVDDGVYLGTGIPAPVAEDTSYVYTADWTHVVRVPKTGGDGGAPEVLATLQPGDLVMAIAVDGMRVYWVEKPSPMHPPNPAQPGGLFVLPLDGGPPVQMCSGVGSPDIVLDTSHVYFSSAVGIYALPK
jgi:hypothetical protein